MPADTDFELLAKEIAQCRICADRFAVTATAHVPRPVFWCRSSAKLLIVGQAPGTRVHASGKPFTDPSGDRLRQWMGISDAQFYDRDDIAILPMGFCFPGYNAKGADLPPPPICARTWRARVMAHLPDVQTTLIIGGYAQKWHLGQAAKPGVTATVQAWRDHAPRHFALPHPSWRNTGWLKNNPWFADDLLPVMQARIAKVLNA